MKQLNETTHVSHELLSQATLDETKKHNFSLFINIYLL
jgi:hypothetical protein